MRRVIIVGSPGAGKSTLALQLAKILDLPVLHLDQEYWHPNWIPTPEDEWRAKMNKLVGEPEWIIDGHYSGTLEMRLARADTIVFLDRSLATCLFRVAKRVISDYGKVRDDMAQGCPEHFDLNFFHYVIIFRRSKRPKIISQLKKSAGTPIYILKTERDVNTFLKEIGKTGTGSH